MSKQFDAKSCVAWRLHLTAGRVTRIHLYIEMSCFEQWLTRRALGLGGGRAGIAGGDPGPGSKLESCPWIEAEGASESFLLK